MASPLAKVNLYLIFKPLLKFQYKKGLIVIASFHEFTVFFRYFPNRETELTNKKISYSF